MNPNLVVNLFRLLLLAIWFWPEAFQVLAHDSHGGAKIHDGPENTNSPAATPEANVRLVAQLDPNPGNNMYTDVWGEGSYAYIGSLHHEEFAIIDIADPAAPKLVGMYHGTTNGFCADIQVKDGVAYMASDNIGTNQPTGVHVVDVSNPTHPMLLTRITAAENGFNGVHNLFVDAQFLYLADFATPVVKVFDVTEPSAPVFVRNIRTTDGNSIHDITVISNRLYTSGWGGNTDIYDVRDIKTRPPVRLGTISTGTSSHSTWVSRDGSILATCSEVDPREVRIYRISDPTRPVRLSTITSQTAGVDAFTPHNPVIVGDLLFVSWYQAGLLVFNIRDPAHPLLVGAFDTFPGGVSTAGPLLALQGTWRGDGCWGVYPLLGLDKVLLSDLDGGLFIVDASRLDGSDADGDRIPDKWEATHLLSASRSEDALLDTDGDRISNLNEFLAGTDPSNQDTPGGISAIEKIGREARLSISAPQDGRLYAIQRNVGLRNTGWSLVRDEVQCTNGIATVIHTNATTANMFYRLLVRP